ncbi:MAG: hypothetical protein GIX03_14500 [Candidatus Eremiobacteraeota bacterium]|nr:hypothetical protein [Candidatus Eremiobacteraeota bacterium]MBC5804176.1 hypothetical protein [Candidatus Eremiobacteraeota bacterium]MBC5823955.1 hypothetical protein [Candidatus Eremiobacteraeota bacterium]
MPRLFTSSVEAGPARDRPILDGSAVIAKNCWNVPRHSVAMIGRPAVWVALDINTPRIALGPLTIPARRLRWEQDFGGHLFLALASADDREVTIIEAGPRRPNQTGALVPFRYPEDHFAQRGLLDFKPIVIEPPHGLNARFFDDLIRRTQRDYDGDQRYLAIEIPFLRVGRDSNSYTVGVLLACGVDPRAIPKPRDPVRFEITGYPGVEDPVHHANFGTYLGQPYDLSHGVLAAPYHDADGSVRLVVIGGEPHGRACTPHGEVTLDRHGRCVLAPPDAERHGLPVPPTAPPEQIVSRRFFPNDPAPAGALITLIVAGHAVPLRPGTSYRGTIVARNDALGLAILRGQEGMIVLPLTELGVELRDPKRVDRLLQIGSELTVGLHRDRHPRLRAHGRAARQDAFRARRAHAPRPVVVATVAALAVAAAAFVAFAVWHRPPAA